MQRFEMAVWAESNGKKIETTYHLDVHLNFWMLTHNSFLDIGIMFPNTVNYDNDTIIELLNVDEIIIYISRRIEQNDVVDITEKFEDLEIRNIVFNEYVKASECCENLPHCKVARLRDQRFCIDTPERDYIEVSEHCNGSKIKIKTYAERLAKFANYQYKRIRLLGPVIHSLFTHKIAPDTYLESYTTKIAFLDFRLNDMRCLSEAIGNITEYCNLDHIRMFLIVENSENVILYSEEAKGIRSLEMDKWKKYMITKGHPSPLDNNSSSMTKKIRDFFKRARDGKAVLAYQWNKNERRDFSLFIETTKSSVGVAKLVIYFLIALAIGALGSCVASCLMDKAELSNQYIAKSEGIDYDI